MTVRRVHRLRGKMGEQQEDLAHRWTRMDTDAMYNFNESMNKAIALAALVISAFPLFAQAPAQDYTPVTADRLKQPEDSDWLMVRRTYKIGRAHV